MKENIQSKEDRDKLQDMDKCILCMLFLLVLGIVISICDLQFLCKPLDGFKIVEMMPKERLNELRDPFSQMSYNYELH